MSQIWIRNSWVSAIGTLYAFAPGLSFYYGLLQDESFSYSPMVGFALATGRAMTNLGYVLIVAAVFKGTFNIFRIQGRGKLFGYALLVLLIGIGLTNFSAF